MKFSRFFKQQHVQLLLSGRDGIPLGLAPEVDQGMAPGSTSICTEAWLSLVQRSDKIVQ